MLIALLDLLTIEELVRLKKRASLAQQTQLALFLGLLIKERTT